MSAVIGLVFPGQGSQSIGMGKAFFDASLEARGVYEEAREVLGYEIAPLCFEGPAEQLNLTEYTQPALLTASIAAYRACGASRFSPRAVAGHSLGEYSAIVAAGGLTFREAIGLVQKRGRYMAEAVQVGSGQVAALLGLDGAVVKQVCLEASSRGVVSAANFNSPGQVVIAGEKAAVEFAIELAKAKGCRKAVVLPVSVPVHTALMQPAADRLAKEMAGLSWRNLEVPLVNNVEAKGIQEAGEVQRSLVRQLPLSVLWEDSVRTMVKMGVNTFVEIGPGTVLSGLIKRIAPDAMTVSIQDPASLEVALTKLNI
jgi:[acyl-carrier-protein] S-malonyltransferase